MIYDPISFGAVGDGSVFSAPGNTVALQKCFSQPNGPGPTYIPPTVGGIVVNNNALVVSKPNTVIYGDASMGSVPSWGPTSTIIGHGPGHTLQVLQGGCRVERLAWKSLAPAEQSGSDAFIYVTGSQVTLRDLYMEGPNVGMSLQLPANAGGEFWIRDCLMGGVLKVAGIVANCGNAAVKIGHVIMYANDPQPPYGILALSAGELVVNDGCDIDNCGNCLAILPGLNGVKGQYVNAITVSDSFFDNGNGYGCVLLSPKQDAYVSIARFLGVWTSSINNASGSWPTNGFTFDGSQSHPPVGLNVAPIMDVTLEACTGRSFVQHCGVYAKSVQGLTILGGTFSGNYTGILIDRGCTGILDANKCGAYTPPPVGGTSGGNAEYGIKIVGSPGMLIGGNNLLVGNGLPGIKILP